MAIYGYARVSSQGQDLTIQREALERAGCEVIREEKASGTTRAGRQELDLLLKFLRSGDTLVVTRIDRLARSMKDFSEIIHGLKARGIAFRCTEQAIDTGGALGELTMNILAAFAQFETQLRSERQAEGIAKAKERRIYKGRPPKIDGARVRELKSGGMGPAAIARELNISESSVYRVLSDNVVPIRKEA